MLVDAETGSGLIRTQAQGAQPKISTLIQAWSAQGIFGWLALAAWLVIVIIVSVPVLVHTPPAFVDEAWNTNRTWGLIQTGKVFGTLDAGVFDKYDGYWTYFPWLAAASHVPFISLFGLNLFAVRMASFTYSIPLLIAVYVIGNRLYGALAGLLATVLVSLSTNYLYSSHLGRHDIIVAALGFTAIALYLTDKKTTGLPIKTTLAGLLVALTLDIHPNGILYTPTILGLFWLDYKWGALRTRRFWGYVAGGVAGVLYFLAMHLLQYPQTYAAIARVGLGASRNPVFFTLDWDVWKQAIIDTLDLMQITLDVVFIAAVIFLVRRWSPSDRRILTLFMILTVGFSLLVLHKQPWYGIVVSPIVGLVVAPFLAELFRGPWFQSFRTTGLKLAQLAIPVGLLALAAFNSVKPVLADNFYTDYQDDMDRVRQAISPGGSVMSSQMWWFSRPEQRYISWDQLVVYRRYKPGSTLEDAFRALNPDYFIIDGWNRDWFLTDDPVQLAHLADYPVLPKTQLFNFLDRKANVVDSFWGRKYGYITIYKLDWNKTKSVSAYFNDLKGFNLASEARIVADFDGIAPGTDITGSRIAGMTFHANTAPLIVGRGIDTYTPSGFKSVIDAASNKLFPTSGANVLSPGGLKLGPGPDPAIENDGLEITFDTPVASVGFDVLLQGMDCCQPMSITLYDAEGKVIYTNNDIPTGNSDFVTGPGGSIFAGFVSTDADIARVVVEDQDSDNGNPDSNLGYDTFRVGTTTTTIP